MISLVAAMDRNRLIGTGNRLPWGLLPADMVRFRSLTLGQVVVMGRKTYGSMGGPLKDRTNVVVSRTMSSQEVACYRNLDGALAHSLGDTYVIGGGQLFKEALPRASSLYITRIEHKFDPGDTPVYFPDFDGFRLISSVVLREDLANPYAMTFQTWERPGRTM